jgi:hypothetical protein
MTELEREQQEYVRRQERKFVAWTRVEYAEETRSRTDGTPRGTEVWLRRDGGVHLVDDLFTNRGSLSERALNIDGEHWSKLVDAVAACRASVPAYVGAPKSPTPHVDVEAWKHAPMAAEPAEPRVSKEQVDPLRGVWAILGDAPAPDEAARKRLNEAYTVLGNFLDDYDKASS